MKKRLLQLTTFILAVVLMAACVKPERENGFTTIGHQLFDANKNPFIIRGVNNHHIWSMDNAYNALDTIASYKTNCIRIVWDTTGASADLEKIIKKCIALEMIPMVELHDATGDSTDTRLLELVDYYAQPEIKNMLDKYNKYLLVNIANEWGSHHVSGEYWYKSYQKAVKKMRDAGYKYTLVIDACGWGQNMEPIFEYGPKLIEEDSLSNLLFSVHMYGSWNDSTKIESSIKKAQKNKIPLIIGEFGYNYNEGDNNLTCMVNHQTLMRVCQEVGYGYLPWSWTGNNEENSWLNMTDSDDWKTLTDWGKELIYSEHGIILTAKKASVF